MLFFNWLDQNLVSCVSSVSHARETSPSHIAFVGAQTYCDLYAITAHSTTSSFFHPKPGYIYN